MRSRLAKLISTKSDTLIMLSATPHDGKANSFASLMNMLNPTAIANPDKYGPEDIKGLFIRRFKKDIIEQVRESFQDREISVVKFSASDEEENAFNAFVDLKFSKIDQRRTAGMLFKTTLEKALFSSPAACLETINNRLKRIRSEDSSLYQNDTIKLEKLYNSVKKIDVKSFSKYQHLLKVIRDPAKGFNWKGDNTKDRLVIFTERIATLKFLEENLKKDLNLKDSQVAILHGTLSDVEMQNIVENFGNEDSPVRLLIGSDVASEGINLHFLSHKMIHFDIPWSLMVFQQRNGRIDRYGQEKKPRIIYLMTQSENGKIKGDTRILEILIHKEEQAEKNIGDPSSLMGVYEIELEENITAEAIETGKKAEEFESSLDEKRHFDPLAILMTEENTPVGENIEKSIKRIPSLFPGSYDYMKEAMEYIKRKQNIQVDFQDLTWTVNLTFNTELENRYKTLAKEIYPENGELILTEDKNIVLEEIKQSRKEERLWPRIQLLWELHPALEWINDKLAAAFGRQEAPVLTIRDKLQENEIIFLIYGIIPNKRSHPLIHRWFGIQYINNQYDSKLEFDEVLRRTNIHKERLPNYNTDVITQSTK